MFEQDSHLISIMPCVRMYMSICYYSRTRVQVTAVKLNYE